jgi:hypothetical protein
MKFAQIASSAAALIALSVSCAHAAPALATSNLNMRQGPGTNYPIVTTIPGGSTVEVGGCEGEWCAVAWQGRRGYAVGTSLDQGQGPLSGPPVGGAAGGPPPGVAGAPPPPPGAPPPGYAGPPPYYPPPPGYYGYGPYYGPYGPYYGPYWRRRWWW